MSSMEVDLSEQGSKVNDIENENRWRFECSLCHRRFTRKANLDIHLRIHTGERPFKCDLCSFSGRDQTVLHRHKLAKHPTVLLKFECDECGQEFTSKSLLRVHRQSQHFGNHECDACGLVYVRKKDMTQHRKYKHPELFEKPFHCETCSRSFTYKHLLTAHRQRYMGTCSEFDIQSDVTSFTCELCKKRFPEIDTFTRHQQSHLEKQWVCDICGSPCSNEHSMKVHRSKHLKLVPRRFQCDACEMSFAKKLTLKLHRKKAHGIIDTCKCTICNEEFPGRLELNHHRKVHIGEKCFECNVCHEKFCKRTSLITHKRKKHTGEKPYVCEICNKRFHATSSLRVHFTKGSCKQKIAGSDNPLEIGENQTECPICHVDFPTPFLLTEHMSIHPTPKIYRSNIQYKVFDCEICGRSFPSKFHRSQHKCEGKDSAFGLLNAIPSCNQSYPVLQSESLLNFKVPDAEEDLLSMSTALCGIDCCGFGSDKDIFCCDEDESRIDDSSAEACTGHGEIDKIPEQFVCEFCNREFINNTYLQNHIKYSPQCKLTDI